MTAVLAGTSTDWSDQLSDLVTLAEANGWTTLMRTQQALSAVPASGGTGYTVGDKLTLVGGTLSGIGGAAPSVFNVDTEAAGVVTGVSVDSAGLYEFIPVDPVATTGGTGTGCTLNVTFQNIPAGSQQDVIMRGDGSGTDEIYVGIRALDFGGGAFNWDIRGFTGFQVGNLFINQPGISPAGSYVPMNNSTITHWIFVNPNRMTLITRMGSTYTNMYLGFGNRIDTEVNYPYPLVVMGCSSLSTRVFSDSTIGFSGMVDPIQHLNAGGPGPGFVRTPSGAWRTVQNSKGTSARTQSTDLVVWPAGNPPVTGTFKMIDFIPPTGNPGAPTSVMQQTPDSTATSNFRFPLYPANLLQTVPDLNVLLELQGVFWAGTLSETAGQAVSEDTYVEGGNTYHVFQNCNRTDPWAHFMIKEE